MSIARRRFAAWFGIGTLAAVVLMIGQANAMGGAMGLIHAGADYSLAGLISDQIPAVPLSPGVGHDGQIFFAIGLDPSGSQVPEVLPGASYRYRRIGFPAVASGLGAIDGPALVWSMAAVTALSLGLAAGATSLIAGSRGLHRWAPLLAVLNPGLWLSVRLLTADMLATGLGLAAVAAYLRRRDRLSLVLLVAAVLTRETSLLFALALAGHAWMAGRRSSAARLVIAPGLVLAGWLGFIQVRMGDALASEGNIGLPGVGILDSVGVWADQAGSDIMWTAIAVVATVVGVAATLQRRQVFWRWVVWPWAATAVCASHLVWDIGNNTIRTLAPLFTLAGLAGLDWAVSSRRQSALTEPASP